MLKIMNYQMLKMSLSLESGAHFYKLPIYQMLKMSLSLESGAHFQSPPVGPKPEAGGAV